MEDIVGIVVAIFGSFVVDRVRDAVASFPVVSASFTLISAVVVVGTGVVIVMTAVFEVRPVVSLLVLAGTDVV